MVYRKNPPDPDALRQLAMARLSGRSGGQAAALLDLPQVERLLEELEIHQIELELQNEHLNTARAQLEQALNQSNELYDFAPVGSALIDTDGNITRLNLAAAQLLASERARLIGSRLGLYVAENQRPQFSAMLARARDEHEAQSAELALKINGLDPLPVQAKVVWIGPELGWQVALVDLSERRRMEEQLRSSEERLKMALSAVGDGVWDWQVDSGEVMISEGFAQLLGSSRAELGNYIADLLSFVHPDDKPRLVQKLQDCIVGKNVSFRNEHRLMRKDGSSKWVLARGAVVLFSAQAQALRMVGTLVDISEKKQAEADLAAAAQFQRAIFDSLSTQVAVLDQDGTVLQTNAAWSSYMSDRGFEQSVDKRYLTLLNEMFAVEPAVVGTLAAGMTALAAAEVPHFNVPMPVQSRCGRWWFSIRITPVQDAAHRLVVTHEDVTAIKRAELASLTLANVDDLTGALSRQNFMGLAEQEMARSLRYALPLVVLMLDLDHFKNVNDSYGHPTGDAVLKGFVQTVKEVLRDSDEIGRIGGEEFAVLLPNTTQEGGCALANRILAAVHARPVSFEGRSVAYTVSIGASHFTHQKSFGEILAECDSALYRAKNAGRDRLELSWDSGALPDQDHSRPAAGR
jgi:diguanylate cyclase (GGDEF)-like protein/PAS domain S-box-containing protein